MSETTIFKKIIDGEISADILHRDEHCLAFRDINPQAPTHVLVIPIKEIPSMAELDDSDQDLLGHMMLVTRRLAADLGLVNGFRTVVNTGSEGGQTVNHLHIHLLAGRNLSWPPG